MMRSTLIYFFGAILAAGLASGQSAEDLRLTVGKSVVIDYPADIGRISTSNPDVVDASPVTTRELLLQAKGVGNSTLVVWNKAGQRTFYNVNVDLNLEPLRRLIRESFPNEKVIVDGSRDSLALNGHVSTKEAADRIALMAAAFSKTVVNNMQIAAPPVDKQILLRVRFAELDRSKELQYGVNLLGQAGNTTFGTTTGAVGNQSFSGTAANGNGTLSQSLMTINQALNVFAFDPKLNLGAFLQALQSESILQILAEPNLVTTNGKEASFLVGGEFPVPILQGGANSGAVTVQFRQFGIRLTFTPNITPNGTIKMHLNQEVSTLDKSNGVILNGFLIPALSTRRAETDVELGEGQSFVVAGLLDNRETESFSKIPVLGNLPIFGALFKTRNESKSRTDLVVLVTPEITQPLGPNDPKPNIYFPKDFLVKLSPNDLSAAAASKKKNKD